jgi:hypothetical protein
MDKTNHKTVIDAVDVNRNTIAQVTIKTDGSYYQEEIKEAITKIMEKHYINVFVED